MPIEVRRQPIKTMRAALVAAMPIILALGGTSILGSEVSAKDYRAAGPAAVALNSVSGGGTTLRSVNVEFPDPERLFPGGDKAEALNNNCLACHSAGMVLTQPYLSRAEWQSEVDKMRNIYKAPIAAEDVAAIVDYLASRQNK
jgi:cytochrome c5